MTSSRPQQPRASKDQSIFAVVVLALILASLFHSCGLT